jgi:hypothetical protein
VAAGADTHGTVTLTGTTVTFSPDAGFAGSASFTYTVCDDGTTNGSLAYWASNAVDASSTVMIQKDGSILKIIPEQHGPWTNGDVISPTAEAAEILSLGATMPEPSGRNSCGNHHGRWI